MTAVSSLYQKIRSSDHISFVVKFLNFFLYQNIQTNTLLAIKIKKWTIPVSIETDLLQEYVK